VLPSSYQTRLCPRQAAFTVPRQAEEADRHRANVRNSAVERDPREREAGRLCDCLSPRPWAVLRPRVGPRQTVRITPGECRARSGSRKSSVACSSGVPLAEFPVPLPGGALRVRVRWRAQGRLSGDGPEGEPGFGHAHRGSFDALVDHPAGMASGEVGRHRRAGRHSSP
jgi:hypothetical protein